MLVIFTMLEQTAIKWLATVDLKGTLQGKAKISISSTSGLEQKGREVARIRHRAPQLTLTER